MVNGFKHSRVYKSPGPDNIDSRVLISCAAQLGHSFIIFSSCPSVRRKYPKFENTVISVAKHNNPKELNDYRPVALTSLVMKCFEKLLKKEVLTKTEHLLDPLQFAYRAKRGVEDATATLLNLLHKHLEGSKTHVRVLFVDFSSAFNTFNHTS